MKKILILFAAISVMAIFSNKVMAQFTLAGNTATAELVWSLTATNTTPLDFGEISYSGLAGTVPMSSAGVRTATGTGIYPVSTEPGTAARFDIAGTADETYTFTLPATITVSIPGGGATRSMVIDHFVTKIDAASEAAYTVPVTGTLSSGQSTVLVGGRLNVGVDQEIGIYTGTYTVIIDYLF
jgi:hypothetical protein